MAMRFPDKDPDEVLDYALDWSRALAVDTIQSATITRPSGTVVLSGIDEDATSQTVWLAGGVLGETSVLLFHIVTAGGRTMERSVSIKIRAK